MRHVLPKKLNAYGIRHIRSHPGKNVLKLSRFDDVRICSRTDVPPNFLKCPGNGCRRHVVGHHEMNKNICKKSSFSHRLRSAYPSTEYISTVCTPGVNACKKHLSVTAIFVYPQKSPSFSKIENISLSYTHFLYV